MRPAERAPFDLEAHPRLVSEAGEDWISAMASADAIRAHVEELEALVRSPGAS